MRRRKNRMPAMLGAGTVSMVFLFFLLCIVTFAVLSYSSAVSDERLSKKAAERTEAYTAASNQAQRHIGILDEAAENIYHRTGSEEEYLKTVREQFGDILEEAELNHQISWTEDAVRASWTEEMTEDQVLRVTLRLTWPQENGYFYTIEQYNTESDRDWEGDTSIRVFGTEEKE